MQMYELVQQPQQQQQQQGDKDYSNNILDE